MTQEEKARRFDEVLAMAKDCITYIPDDAVNQYMLDMFPELKESEGEKIRKVLIGWINLEPSTSFNDTFDGFSKEQILDWLEKQGQTFTKKDVDDAYLKGVCDAKQELEKQGEQKPADMVEPRFKVGDTITYIGERRELVADKYTIKEISKNCYISTCGNKIPFSMQEYYTIVNDAKFKVGDWVVNKFCDLWHIDSLDNKNYQVSDGKGNYNYFPISKQDEMHLWTIQDANDGDVLACNEEILLFKSYSVQGRISLYCWYNGQTNNFHSKEVVDTLMTTRNKICPATKEQRDLLFQKMREDEIKKELKKIEQNPARSEEDEERIKNILSVLDVQVCWDGATGKKGNPYQKEIDWLKSIKDRVQPQPKHWSEEDEDAIGQAIVALKDMFDEDNPQTCYAGYKLPFIDAVERLKSLKNKYTWKPSDEQMNILSIYAHVHDGLASLYQDLKKLKG